MGTQALQLASRNGDNFHFATTSHRDSSARTCLSNEIEVGFYDTDESRANTEWNVHKMWRRQRGEIKHDTKNELAEEDASISTVAKAVAIECTCQADFQARKRPKPWEGEHCRLELTAGLKHYGITFTRAFLQS